MEGHVILGKYRPIHVHLGSQLCLDLIVKVVTVTKAALCSSSIIKTGELHMKLLEC